ncbi:aminopeptidase P family protein [Clostridium tarantellae]|uniref:Xaa-Pro aminopeptidase n=1 Tax=Clostridium tarantellae TaxID=39493 RepID=A0A6I1MNL7_9CLOT|nr:aminopeptidase P family protein [Clostridium tarantellae]MPQ43697.1 M24 family metallopeptidase [Clostridium tarantellae]
MNNKVYISNRNKLLKKISDNSIVILFAGEAKQKTADEKYAFTPNRNFYYMTGVHEEHHILVLEKINKKVNEVLYILRPDPVMEKWNGKTLRKDEAKNITGINEIKFLDELFNDLNNKFISGKIKNVYLDLERRSYEDDLTETQKFAKNLRDKYANVQIENAYNLIAELRKIKCAEEIEEIKKAIDITTKGVELLMKKCKCNMKEYELEAYFDFYIKQQGVKDFAFKTIAASGKNSTVLHYVSNDSLLRDGDLILFDLGAQINYYNADISRTFPVNGKFTERQKEVYESVLKVNETIISMIRPGITFLELNNKANELIGEECIKLGLINNKNDFKKYYYHSIGHSLGLDTHDVGERWGELKEGMVLTVEPGIYIEEENIGIRIEDDVLITKDGNEVLTKNCIKSIKDIENFMNNI